MFIKALVGLFGDDDKDRKPKELPETLEDTANTRSLRQRLGRSTGRVLRAITSEVGVSVALIASTPVICYFGIAGQPQFIIDAGSSVSLQMKIGSGLGSELLLLLGAAKLGILAGRR